MKNKVIIILGFLLVFAIGIFVGIKVIDRRLEEYSKEELPDKILSVIETREKDIAEKEVKEELKKIEYVEITEEISKEDWVSFEDAYNTYFNLCAGVASVPDSDRWNEVDSGIDETIEKIKKAEEVLLEETPKQLKDRVYKTINIVNDFVPNYSQKKYTKETYEIAYWDYWNSITNLRTLIKKYSQEYGF